MVWYLVKHTNKFIFIFNVFVLNEGPLQGRLQYSPVIGFLAVVKHFNILLLLLL
jgi:hypothetical protein